MVLYHPDGRVVIGHEDYLEREALKHAVESEWNYPQQQDTCKALLRAKANPPQEPSSALIVIEVQEFRTLYTTYPEDDNAGDVLSQFTNKQRITLETGVDKATFSSCSTLAHDIFRYNSDSVEVKVPAECPPLKRLASEPIGDGFPARPETLMAFIRREEIEEYIIPWLKSMAKYVRNKQMPEEQREQVRQSDLPKIKTPTDLLGKIHLYNAMLQFGLPMFVQRDLIDALVLQMYQTRLSECHLETLEMTVCRFYGKSIAILDPVISHFIGTYAFRSLADRKYAGENLRIVVPEEEEEDGAEKNPGRLPRVTKPKATKAIKAASTKGKKGAKTKKQIEEEEKAAEDEQKQIEEAKAAQDAEDEKRQAAEDKVKWLPYSNLQRKFLQYSTENGNRKEYPDDTIIVTPKLPVLAHCIRHWSDLRRNDSIAAAHNGYPLNVGMYKKFYRREPKNALGHITCNTGFGDDYIEYSTYRLNRSGPGEMPVKDYGRYPPGNLLSPPRSPEGHLGDTEVLEEITSPRNSKGPPKGESTWHVTPSPVSSLRSLTPGDLDDPLFA